MMISMMDNSLNVGNDMIKQFVIDCAWTDAVRNTLNILLVELASNTLLPSV